MMENDEAREAGRELAELFLEVASHVDRSELTPVQNAKMTRNLNDVMTLKLITSDKFREARDKMLDQHRDEILSLPEDEQEARVEQLIRRVVEQGFWDIEDDDQ